LLTLTLAVHLFASPIISWYLFYLIGAGGAAHFKAILNKPLHMKVIRIVFILFLIMQLYRIIIYNPNLNYVEARKTISYKIYEMISPLLFWGANDFIDFEKIKIRKWEKYTFFVYVSHYMAVSLMCSNSLNGILGLPTENIFLASVIFMITPIFTYIVLTFIGMGLNKCCPRGYRLLSGGR
jgi:hypothetical protein